MSKNSQEYINIITFVKELERLKDATRTAWTKEGRQESVAEHSWRLALFAMALEDYFPELNSGRLLRMCLIHDLGEAYEGDVSATIEVNQEDKLIREEKALQKLLESLSEDLKTSLLALWREYNEGETKEARLAKAIDKIETIIQHNQGDNPPDFNYVFNLKYGREYALYHPVIKSIREIIDAETQSKVKKDSE